MKKQVLVYGLFLFLTVVSVSAQKTTWISTTETAPWQTFDIPSNSGTNTTQIEIFPNKILQQIDGFGSCFNELGWTSLNELKPEDREKIFHELFEPGYGAGFTICRMPIGANDFSRDWYSYDETEGDFELKNFSIKNDLETLIPFIKSAQKYNPKLQLWASPWSPPSWMKYNKHYALAKVPSVFGTAENGISDNQLGKEGEDMFVQEEAYFKAYAVYFRKFIEAYKKKNITIGMVMPQNEFNSAQWYPSCTWTPGGLLKFLKFLGPEMAKTKTDIFFGTFERPSEQLFKEAYSKEVSSYIKGVGFQWGGKDAVGKIHKEYPQLKIYQSEHECGDGQNSWEYCEYGWDLIKHYFQNGANAYLYWNTALNEGGVSRWGWKQNSLITVNKNDKTYKYNPEYYMMKHLSHFVKPGAHLIESSSIRTKLDRDDVLFKNKVNLDSNSDNLLAFKNPDNSIVVVIYNPDTTDKAITLRSGETVLNPIVKSKSFNTFLIKEL